MKPIYLLSTLLLFAISCKKHQSSSGSTAPPANSTNITANIQFPDGRSYTCIDYSLPDGVDNIIDGTKDTIVPVIWADTNNLDYGYVFFTYGVTGLSAGKTYALFFSTPPYYNNSNFGEVNDPLHYQSGLSWTTGETILFQFGASRYNIPQLSVSTQVPDSTSSPTNGGFTLLLYADSVSTGGVWAAYPYSSPITINATFNNITYR